MSNNAQVSKAIQEASQQVPADDVAPADFFAELIASRQDEQLASAWGSLVRIVRLPAADRLEILTAEGSEDQERSGAGWQWAVLLLSKAIRDRDGNAPFDSDRGRSFLELEDPLVLGPLGDIAMRLNNLSGRSDTAKKNGSPTR